MRKIIVVILINMVLLWGVSAFAQSPELLNAIKTAEEQRQQGKLVEAFKTLVAIEPVVSKMSPLSSLENHYDEKDAPIRVQANWFEYPWVILVYLADDKKDAKLLTNEFYLKDRELVKLTEAFLQNRQSDNAVVTAQCIANRMLRNGVLLDILDRQRLAARNNKQKEFDLMMAKAEKTATLLTDVYRDIGYWRISRSYYNARKLEPSVEALKKIKDIEFRDATLVWNARNVAHDYPAKTLENEKVICSLVDFVHSPLMKVKARCILAGFYNNEYAVVHGTTAISEADCKRKYLEALHEAGELLLPLPDNADKVAQLRQIHFLYGYGKQETEAATVRKTIFDCIANIQDDDERFQCFDASFNRLSNHRGHFDPPYVDFPANPELIMAMKHIVEKTNDPEIRASRWRVLLVVARRSPHFGSEEQKEVFHDAHQAALRIGNPIRRSTLLLELAAETYGSEAGTLLEEVVEIIVPHGDETVSANDDRVSLMKQAISLLVERGNAERMLEIVHSPDIPDDWKLELYRKAADALRHDPNISVFDDDPNPIFFRANDHKKLIDLIESRK